MCLFPSQKHKDNMILRVTGRYLYIPFIYLIIYLYMYLFIY